ncbi:RuvA C-terminal domain-containing protein, partial [Nguyenibacter vanlangensis]
LALAGLGFRRAEAQPVVARIVARLDDKADLDVVIRESLRDLAK